MTSSCRGMMQYDALTKLRIKLFLPEVQKFFYKLGKICGVWCNR